MSPYYTPKLVEDCAKFGYALPADLPMDQPYWCCHHEILFEMVDDPYKRISFILENKAYAEIARRLTEFQPIKNIVALAEYERVNGPALAELDALHRLEVPGTFRDGKTIFPAQPKASDK